MLIVGTLHQPDVRTVIEFVLDELGADDQDRMAKRLAQTLRAIICQRMCRRKDGKGLIPAFEALATTHAVGSLIRDHNLKDLHGMMQGGESGMMTFNDCLLRYVQEQKITAKEAMQQSPNPDELLGLFTRNQIAV